MNKKLKTVFIGAGGRANDAIYPAFYSLPEVDMAAICDIDEERLNRTGDKYRIARRYGRDVNDYRRMVEEIKPDAVVAVGQPNIMYDIWRWCLEKGLNLYIEKPLGLSIHQARNLRNLAEQHSCVAAVSFQRRYSPMVSMLREECVKYGPITHAFCKFYKYSIDPLLEPRDHMMDDCVHAIDTLRWICSGTVVKIDSHVKRVMVPDINFISATVHFDNGSTGYLINSWSSGKRIFAVEMHAPGIYVEAEHEGKAYLYIKGDVKGIEYDARDVAGSKENFIFTGVQAAVRDFVYCCQNGGQPSSCFADACRTMEAAEIILAQALLENK